MEKILISACFLGQPVRYDGESKPIQHPLLTKWQREKRLVVICPEVAGGLPIPRPAAEIQINGTVKTELGEDVTVAFSRGAERALDLCRQHEIKLALLKESSPSCGSQYIYDGSFTGEKIRGQGKTAELLSQHGVSVFSELSLLELADKIAELEG